MNLGQRSRLPTGQSVGFSVYLTTSIHFRFNSLSISLCRQLLEMTCRLGNLLRRYGVKKGDCITIYMPPCPLAVASMLACARIGAAHNVVFAGFSAEALADRIRDGESAIDLLMMSDNLTLRINSKLKHLKLKYQQ